MENLFDENFYKTAPIFMAVFNEKPMSWDNALSMMEALNHPAVVYLLEDGTCLIQGNCDRLASNHRFFQKFKGILPEKFANKEFLVPKPKVASA